MASTDQPGARSILLWALVPAAGAIAAWAFNKAPGGGVLGPYDIPRFVMNLAITYLAGAIAYIGLRPADRKRRALNAALLTVSLAICLALLEAPVVFTSLDYAKVFPLDGGDTTLQLGLKVNRPDPKLISVHWPNSRYEGYVVGNLAGLGIPDPPRHKVEVSYDSNGFRNPRERNRAEIIAIGDSFVEGAIVPLDDTVVRRLEERLSVAVANLGQAGYGLKQELEVLKRFGLPLEPSVVLWFFFGGNDLRDVDDYDQTIASFDAIRQPRSAIKRSFTRNAFLALSVFLGRFDPQAGEKARQQSGLFNLADGSQERVYFGAADDKWKPHEWNTATEVLSEAARLTEAAGAELIVVYIGRKFNAYRDQLAIEPGTKIAEWRTSELPSVLGDWCASQGISFIDTMPAMTESVAQGVHPHLIDDVHWNAHGHAIVADLIAEHLSTLESAGTPDPRDEGTVMPAKAE